MYTRVYMYICVYTRVNACKKNVYIHECTCQYAYICMSYAYVYILV